MPDKIGYYKGLWEDEKRTYLKYKDPDKASADGHEADAEAYATRMVNRAKKRDAEKRKLGTVGLSTTKRPQQKSKGGGVKKPVMAYGGMANKKKHMYTAGGSVKDYKPMQSLKKKY